MLYPNPNEGRFWLDMQQVFRRNYEIIIYDIWGKAVAIQTIADEAKPYLSVEQLPKGTYILAVRDRNKRVVKRLIKH
jgi:hypothetical protein